MPDQPVAKRRFLPQPIESTTKVRRGGTTAPPAAEVSNGLANGDAQQPNPPEARKEEKPRRRFAPQPVETTTKSSRQKAAPDSQRPRNTETKPELGNTVKKGGDRRRFAPQLLETTTRSRKAGDNGPNLSASDKTEALPGAVLRSSHRVKTPSSSLRARAAEEGRSSHNLDSPAVPMAGPHVLRKSRQHSFVIPNLESIPSSESEQSNCPSLSTSPSACSEGVLDLHGPHSKMRESCDDRFSGYLLDLAARAAEKQLRDQAMAAFPNDEFHETVDHFAIDRDSDAENESDTSFHVRGEDETGVGDSRQSSADSTNWEVRQMRRHHQSNLFSHERLGSLSRGSSHDRRKNSGLEREKSKERRNATAKKPSLNPFQVFNAPNRESKFDHMCNAANPPMLGSDLVFRTCLSPQATKLEVDQYPCSNARRRDDGGGLWMGFCTADDTTAKDRPSTPTRPVAPKIGLLTPESSPSHSHSANEPAISDEFSDAFVTQVYNYLSLGYPSLASKFDAELSKISHAPLEELSHDDNDASALKRGFIELEDVGQDPRADEGERHRCARWQALRLYIREWARQHPNPEEEDTSQGALDSWGARARRGSWAV